MEGQIEGAHYPLRHVRSERFRDFPSQYDLLMAIADWLALERCVSIHVVVDFSEMEAWAATVYAER